MKNDRPGEDDQSDSEDLTFCPWPRTLADLEHAPRAKQAPINGAPHTADLHCCQMLIGHVVVILRSYQFSPQAIKKDIGFCALLFTNLFCSSVPRQRTKYLC